MFDSCFGDNPSQTVLFFPCAWVLAGTIQSIARSTSTKTTNWTTTGTLWRVKVCGMRPRHNFWLLLLAVTWSHHGWTSEVMWLTKIRFFSGHLQKPWTQHGPTSHWGRLKWCKKSRSNCTCHVTCGAGILPRGWGKSEEKPITCVISCPHVSTRSKRTIVV